MDVDGLICPVPLKILGMIQQRKRKVLWAITSSGDLISEIIDSMIEVQEAGVFDIDVITSAQSPFVLKYYKQWDRLQEHFKPVWVEKGPNSPFLGGPIQRGKYSFIVVAPVTGNTMAKIAHGIADALVPNCVALALKAAVPVYLFPTDQEKIGEETVLVDGTVLKLYPRQVDLQNVERARQMKHVTVLPDVPSIKKILLDLGNAT